MESVISAIGTSNPIYARPQRDASALVAATLGLTPVETRVLRSVYHATGIDNRFSVLSDYCKLHGEFEFFPNNPDDPFPSTARRMEIYKENALPLAIAAIEDCLSSLTNFSKNEITHLITVSCTGMYAPGLDIELVHAMELNSHTKRTCINFMGCYGAFNAIKVADAFCRADKNANVLIVCVELCTLHFQKNTSMDNMVSNAIFADGAAAVLIQSSPSANKSLSLHNFCCELLPQTSNEMAWTIADSGFDIVLSSYVPEAIQSGIGAFLAKVMRESTFANEPIDFYAIHPGGMKILQACEEALNITTEDNRFSYEVLRKFGNMSSATVLFVLKELWDSLTAADHGKNIFSCAFGPGLTLESMLLRVNV